jgi:DNA/RNA-binding domain of Phe-tRNA-synthetase-like protein
MVRLPQHPLLEPAILDCTLSSPLGELVPSPELLQGLSLDFEGPLATDDEVKGSVRKLLRHAGFKPSGRNKPASEYLIKAAEKGFLGSINLVVDVCNVVSLHSGLPISVVDLDRTEGDLAIGIGEGDYVFNPAGQELRLDGLLCLRDAQGWCANSVKDSQRTKTTDHTLRALYVVWGTTALPGRAAQAADWATSLLELAGVHVERRL